MNSRELRADAMLLFAALIWGLAFVAQRLGMEHLGPFSFNAIRFALGSLILLPVWLVARSRQDAALPAKPPRGAVWIGGLVTGLLLFLGASLQQVGLVYTTAGKAGFITGLYVVLVPLLGLVRRQRAGGGAWFGAITAALGLFLLSVRQDFTVGPGDALVFAGAFFWAGHVLTIGHWTRRVDAIELAAVQFAICSGLSLVVSVLFETTTLEAIFAAAVPLLYGGICSVGIAFTIQVVAQRDASPAATAVLLSLESVFAALGGWLILGEVLSPRGIAGCALMLAGVLISRLWRAGRS